MSSTADSSPVGAGAGGEAGAGAGASAAGASDVPGLSSSSAELLAQAEALERVLWDTEDADMPDEALADLNFTRAAWEAGNTAFKPICLMASQASAALHAYAQHKSRNSGIPAQFFEQQRRAIAPSDSASAWRPIPGKGYLQLAYDSVDEALACRTTPKKFLFVPYVPGYVRAQGYAGLATALGKYKPDREFVLLASINSPKTDFTRLKAWIIPARGQDALPEPDNGFVRVLDGDAASTRVHAVCSGPGCKVADDLKLCVGCRSTAYCGHACQKAHWKAAHKKECKELKKRGPVSEGAIAGMPTA